MTFSWTLNVFQPAIRRQRGKRKFSSILEFFRLFSEIDVERKHIHVKLFNFTILCGIKGIFILLRVTAEQNL